MPQMPQIGARGREILTAIVQTYISTGEPVGSRTLARDSREGLSAATIRNVMSDLTDAGFLEQPHTSAGRVPTANAYRYYVCRRTSESKKLPNSRRKSKGKFKARFWAWPTCRSLWSGPRTCCRLFRAAWAWP